MVGIDGIIFEDESNPVIRYDCIYIPNPSACPGESYRSYADMMRACRVRLERAEKEAEEHKKNFTAYKCDFELKPEFT